MTPDHDLLSQFARQGDESAFAELVRRHLPWVYSTALRLVGGDAPLAQDVAQSVFTDLARRAEKISHYDAPGGWLHTATRFAAAKAVAGERRRRAREHEAAAMQIASTSPEISWEQMRPLLDAAIGRLAEADRHAVVLRFFEGKSHREIGEITGLTEDSARKRTERAVDKLRTQFSRRGLAVTVGLLAEAISTNSVQAAPAGLTETVTVAALKGAVVAGTLSSAVLFSIFTMTTKTKLIIAAIAIIAAAIPTYYLMTSAGGGAANKAIPLSSRSNSPSPSPAATAKVALPLAAAEANSTGSPVRIPVGSSPSAMPKASATPAPSVKITPTPVAAPDAATLAALKQGLLEYKQSADLDKLDPAGLAQLKVWAQSDPQGVITWLSDVPDDNKQHEHTMEAMMAMMIDADPATALTMAKAINDPMIRSSRIEDALTALALQNPAAAAAALDAAGLPEGDDNRTAVTGLIDIIQSGKLTDDMRARLIEKIHK